ncbi:MAG: DNA polymerase II small subunit, partial [Nanoarchaeota archaeon]|nr:DNA polymerase II small subunit [Nanoarchaeota archaeon]
MIKAKHETKNNNIILTLEDKTGCINVLISKTKPDLYAIGADIVLDDIIGVVGTSGNKIVFANNVLLPDIPLTRELKKADKPAWAAFLGDPHFGSKAFL